MIAPMLEARNLTMGYKLGSQWVKAVDDVTFDLGEGEILGIVGESGSGKSSLALALLGALPPNASILGGAVFLREQDITRLAAVDPAQHRRLRWREIALVFQNAMSALNPVYRVKEQLLDVLREKMDVSGVAATRRLDELIQLVSLSKLVLDRYPHELSGGTKQRVMMAMALACSPKVLIADEPTTALDVVVQDQLLGELCRLRDLLGLSMILISHDVALIGEACDRIAVMYGGQIFEYGPASALRGGSRNPYTILLLSSVATLRGSRKPLRSIPGDPPSLTESFSGCRFHARCPLAQEICRREVPTLIQVNERHFSRCHFALDPAILSLAAPREC